VSRRYIPVSVGKEEMNCMIAVDTNVIVYSMDDSVPHKHLEIVVFLANLRAANPRINLLWQVACEVLAWLQRQRLAGLITHQDIAVRLDEIHGAYDLVLPDADVFEISLSLMQSYSLSHWDSLLLAACISAGVYTLYSEDMSHGATYDSVTVMNRFA
jgi:predicted nucleic acid-binding protein